MKTTYKNGLLIYSKGHAGKQSQHLKCTIGQIGCKHCGAVMDGELMPTCIHCGKDLFNNCSHPENIEIEASILEEVEEYIKIKNQHNKSVKIDFQDIVKDALEMYLKTQNGKSKAENYKSMLAIGEERKQKALSELDTIVIPFIDKLLKAQSELKGTLNAFAITGNFCKDVSGGLIHHRKLDRLIKTNKEYKEKIERGNFESGVTTNHHLKNLPKNSNGSYDFLNKY